MPDRDPMSVLLHRLDDFSMATVEGSPGDLRRRGDRRRRTRSIALAAACVTVVGAVVWNGSSPGVLRTTPAPPATRVPATSAPVPPPPSAVPTSPSTLPSHTAPPAAVTATGTSRPFLRPRDLSGVGVAGRTWRTDPDPRTVFLGCDLSAVDVGPDEVVQLVEVGADGRPVPTEGPVVQEVVSDRLRPEGRCTGSTWTTLTDSAGLLLQRRNGDPAKAETPWATYRFVVQAGTTGIEATASFGESVEQDGVAVRVAARLLERATGRTLPTGPAATSLRTTDLMPGSALGPDWTTDSAVPPPQDPVLAYLPCFPAGARPTPSQALAGALIDSAATLPAGTRQQLLRFDSADGAASWVKDLRAFAGCDTPAERSDVTVPHGVALREATGQGSAVRAVVVQQVGTVVSVTRVFVGDGDVPAQLVQQVADGVSAALCRFSTDRTC